MSRSLCCLSLSLLVNEAPEYMYAHASFVVLCIVVVVLWSLKGFVDIFPIFCRVTALALWKLYVYPNARESNPRGHV